MTKKLHSSKVSAKSSARLGAYLAAGVGASLVATPSADAAIIGIDIGTGPGQFDIGGINGGLSSGSLASFMSFPSFGEGTLQVYNNYSYEGRTFLGLAGAFGLYFEDPRLQFAGGVGFAYATPTNFALNQAIDGSTYFSYLGSGAMFQFTDKNGTSTSPDFGPGSYMGFRTASGNYGWLEVTWDSADQEFQILSGAYESVAGVAILAGDSGTAAVPEPSTFAMGALLSGGAAFVAWRKRRQKVAKKAA